MRLMREHHQDRVEDVVQRVDESFADLLHQPLPSGAQVVEVQRDWEGNTLRFAVKGRRGMFSAKIHGTVDVTPEQVVLDAEVPPMLTAIMPEERVQEMLERHLDRMFPPRNLA